jgi:hypothetical protein
MKEIKHVSLSEIVLIPAKEKFEEDYPFSHYVGSIIGSNGEISTSIQVMIFNCKEANEISSVIDLEIKDTGEYIVKNPEDKELLSSQLDFFSSLKKDIENLSLRHEPSEELINVLSDKGFHELKKENVIFISGVSSLIES